MLNPQNFPIFLHLPLHKWDEFQLSSLDQPWCLSALMEWQKIGQLHQHLARYNGSLANVLWWASVEKNDQLIN